MWNLENYIYMYIHAYLYTPALITKSVSRPIIAAQCNYMIFAPILGIFLGTGRVGLCIWIYSCMFVYIKELLLPFMLQSCITTINSLHHRFWNSKQCKIYSGKLYMFIVTKYIYYIYIWLKLIEYLSSLNLAKS